MYDKLKDIDPAALAQEAMTLANIDGANDDPHDMLDAVVSAVGGALRITRPDIDGASWSELARLDELGWSVWREACALANLDPDDFKAGAAGFAFVAIIRDACY
jgi:hypothetical protein